MYGFSLLSAANFTEHLNKSLALLRICITNCLERHFCQVLLHTVCLREAKFQLCVLVGGLVSVTSTAGGSSSGVDESGYELQRSLCPLRFKTTGLGFNVHHANRAHRAQPSRHASLSARLTSWTDMKSAAGSGCAKARSPKFTWYLPSPDRAGDR